MSFLILGPSWMAMYLLVQLAHPVIPVMARINQYQFIVQKEEMCPAKLPGGSVTTKQ